MGDTVSDAAHEIVIDRLNGYLYNVGCVDGTDDAEPFECSLAVFDSC